MSKGIDIGVQNLARKVIGGDIGVNNIARKILRAYIGDEDSKARLFYESHKEDEELAPFTYTQTWTVPSDAQTIDIFCVGGGGGAGGCMCHEEGWMDTGGYYRYDVYGASGGSGYTATAMGVSVTPGETLTINIGNGGAGGTSYSDVYGLTLDTSSDMSAITNGGDGGTSSVYRGSTALATAAGGKGGLKAAYAGVNSSNKSLSYINFTNGSNGGCGSGVAGAESEKTLVGSTVYWGYYEHSNESSPSQVPSHQYGTNGNGRYDEDTNGGKTDFWGNIDAYTGQGNRIQQNKGTAGTGQGRNTRKYGTDYNTIYSIVAGTQSANTGNSGSLGKTVASSKAGSSGVVIITVHYS